MKSFIPQRLLVSSISRTGKRLMVRANDLVFPARFGELYAVAVVVFVADVDVVVVVVVVLVVAVTGK